MTDRAQFEAMLEALINEDQETAKEIFHNIVVAKSREIYEELLAEDFDIAEIGEPGASEEEEETLEAFGDEEGADDEEGSADDEEGSADDEEGADDFGGEEEGEDLSDEEQTDRILDLEDALDELKAEFEQMMAGEEGEGHDEFGGDEFGGDDFGGDDLDAELDEIDGMDQLGTAAGGAADAMGQMNEYVNKVTPPKHGDNGVNTKSAVAGKNDMGGTASNIAQNGKANSTTFANQGQLKGNGVFKGGKPQVDNAGNINVPGGKAGKTAFKHREPGHGAESKGKGEQAPNKKSIIGSRG